MSSTPPVDSEPDLEACARAAAGLLDLPLDAVWIDGVVANLRVLRAAGTFVGAFPLPDEVEAAPVFTA